MSFVIRRSRITSTPRVIVLARLRHALTWPNWGPFTKARIERPGTDGPSSPGEIRWFYTPTTASREEVLPSEGDVVLRYKLLEGLPVDDYIAEVAIRDREGGQLEIMWSARFTGRNFISGAFYRAVLSFFFGMILDGLTAPPKPRLIVESDDDEGGVPAPVSELATEDR